MSRKIELDAEWGTRPVATVPAAHAPRARRAVDVGKTTLEAASLMTDPLAQALRSLADRTRDRQCRPHAFDKALPGFSSADEPFALSMIEAHDNWGSWTERQHMGVRRIVHRYRRQLGLLGYDAQKLLDACPWPGPVDHSLGKAGTATSTSAVWVEATLVSMSDKAIQLAVPSRNRPFWVPHKCLVNGTLFGALAARIGATVKVAVVGWFAKKIDLLSNTSAVAVGHA